MERMFVKNLLDATKGTLLCGKEDLPVERICINSKETQVGDLFVPLIGEKVDAHRFIKMALEAGANVSLTSEHDEAGAKELLGELWDSGKVLIRVDDTKKALQQIGSYYRKRLSLPLVGVTGSVGKTTTREMIAAALSGGFQVFKTPGNHNSQIGVPITMTEISSQDEIGVIELGMSEPGELTIIAQIAQINMAVITNIGITHIEQLGSQENIYKEKMTIQDGLKEGGILFLNGDDPMLKVSHAKAGCETIYYGTGENSQYRAEEIHMENGYASFTANCDGRKIPVTLQVPGAHQVLNAMAALAVADKNEVPLAAAAAKLAEFGGFKNRQQIYELDGITVIDDTYNASPVSMCAAIDILVSRKADRRVAVLADMKELGPETRKFHYEVGTYLGKAPVDVLVTYGDLALEIEKGAKEQNPSLVTVHFQEHEKAAMEQWIQAEEKKGDCILFKGSNSMKLGEVAEHVCQRYH